jgi:hypothetical protein
MLRRLFSAPRSAGARRQRCERPGVEAIEVRRVLATFTVVNTADSGPGSLRQAILDSDQRAGPNQIRFSIGTGTKIIAVRSPLPTVTTPVLINGLTQAGVNPSTAAPVI